MNLSLALDLTNTAADTPVAPQGAPTMPEWPKTANFREFSALLSDGLDAFTQGAETSLDGLPDALPADALPDTGNILPVAGGKGLPVGEQEAPASQIAHVQVFEIVAPAAAVATNAVTPEQSAALQAEAINEAADWRKAPAQHPAVLNAKAQLVAQPITAPITAPTPQQADPAASDSAKASGETKPTTPRPALQVEITAQQTGKASPAEMARVVATSAAFADKSAFAHKDGTKQFPQAAATVVGEQPQRRTRAEVAGPRTARLLPEASATDTAPQAKPSAPTPASAPIIAAAQTTPLTMLADAPRPASSAPADSAPSTQAAPQRHDFGAVVERLSEARELARPGSANMQINHREFGNVSVQFDMAGQALKVAMSSSDAAFAPAVQAALAERPIAALSESQRSDSNSQRQDGSSQNAGGQSGQNASQTDGQRQDPNSRANQARQTGEQNLRRTNDDEAQASHSTQNGRAGGLFA